MDGREHAAQIHRLGGNLRVVAFQLQVCKQADALLQHLIAQMREFALEKLAQIQRGDRRHLDHHETRGQGFIQFAGPRVAVIHRGDKARQAVEHNFVITGHVDDAAEVEGGVEDGDRLVLGHVDLVENAEPAADGALVDGAAEVHDAPVLKRIGAD